MVITQAGLKKLLRLSEKSQKASVKFPKKVNQIKKDAATAGVRAAIYKTRVDTSKARSNWQVSVGVENSRKREAFFKGKNGSTKGPSSDAAYKFAKWEIGKAKSEQALYITNPQDYVAEKLEPLDWMVQHAVIEIEYKITKKAASLRIY
jgi:hypothetical protein